MRRARGLVAITVTMASLSGCTISVPNGLLTDLLRGTRLPTPAATKAPEIAVAPTPPEPPATPAPTPRPLPVRSVEPGEEEAEPGDVDEPVADDPGESPPEEEPGEDPIDLDPEDPDEQLEPSPRPSFAFPTARPSILPTPTPGPPTLPAGSEAPFPFVAAGARWVYNVKVATLLPITGRLDVEVLAITPNGDAKVRAVSVVELPQGLGGPSPAPGGRPTDFVITRAGGNPWAQLYVAVEGFTAASPPTPPVGTIEAITVPAGTYAQARLDAFTQDTTDGKLDYRVATTADGGVVRASIKSTKVSPALAKVAASVASFLTGGVTTTYELKSYTSPTARPSQAP